jgi:hypothetical protein
LVEIVLEIRLPEACRPTGKCHSIGLHGGALMGCRKGSPKGHILDHGLGVELQKAVLLGWLIEAGKHVHTSRINNGQESRLPSGSHNIAHLRGLCQHRMVGDEGRKEVALPAHD